MQRHSIGSWLRIIPLPHRRIVGILAILLVPMFMVNTVGAVDSYSNYYNVKDGTGHTFSARAMVRNTPYSDHIYANSFWLRLDVTMQGRSLVCEHYKFSRTTPTPSSGTLSDYGWPFPLNYSNTPQWTYAHFGQDMYWGSSSSPVSIEHIAASESVCGSASSWRGAGIKMYRFPTYWHELALTN